MLFYMHVKPGLTGVKPGLTRREEHRLTVFEIRVLRVISGPKRER